MSIHWISVMISLLIVANGLLASRTLNRVDQDLRVIYAEYTLAVTDLGRVNGELIRYRTSATRATEADTHEAYERIAASCHRSRRASTMPSNGLSKPVMMPRWPEAWMRENSPN